MSTSYSSGQAGLFSTFLYGGIACSYLPGGMLADRYGSRRVLMGALLLIGAGGCLLPLVACLPWMVGCRLLIGLGAGAAIVAGSQAAARLGDYAALGQGLYGLSTVGFWKQRKKETTRRTNLI